MVLFEDFAPHKTTLKEMGWRYPDDLECMNGIEAQLLYTMIEMYQENKRLRNQVKRLASQNASKK